MLPELKFVQGDIFEQVADVLVNSANKSLLAGSGISGQVFAKAGKTELEAECMELLKERNAKFLAIGDAIITKAYELPYKAIIHTVAPKNDVDNIAVLQESYRNALFTADGSKYRSIVFPLLGTGINNIPVAYSAYSAKRALQHFRPTYLHTVIFCSSSADAISAFESICGS